MSGKEENFVFISNKYLIIRRKYEQVDCNCYFNQ